MTRTRDDAHTQVTRTPDGVRAVSERQIGQSVDDGPGQTACSRTVAVPAEVAHSERIVCDAVPRRSWDRHELPMSSRPVARPKRRVPSLRGSQSMRSIRPSFTVRRGSGPRRTSPALAAVALASALALTATACNGDDTADGKPSASATAASGGDGKIQIPDDL